MSLGAANAIDYAMQFLLPVVLVRFLDASAFGEYRLIWLAAGTAMAVITQAIPGSLYLFLPRSDAAGKRLYINQTLLYMAGAGLVAAVAFSVLNPWLPEKMAGFASRHELLLPAFVLLWVFASILDLIASAEERVAWQASATIGLSGLRAVSLSLAAILTGELEPVLITLLVFVAFKCAVLLFYVARYHGLRGPVASRRAFTDQIRYSAPFGLSAALYGLRMQLDQWVAAALFSVSMFASFSIGAVLAPLVQICRQSVVHAFLPGISRLQAAGDIAGMLALNNRGNIMVGAIVYPLLAIAFAFAEDIITIIYTSSYVDAAAVMRIYIFGLAVLVVELQSIMLLLRQGKFSLFVGVFALGLSGAVSWIAAGSVGLAGAAAGSVTAIYVDHTLSLRRIARCTGIRVGRLQDWRSIGVLLSCAVAAGLFSWVVVTRVFATHGAMTRVAVGALLVAGVYCALVALSGVAWSGKAGPLSSTRAG